MRILTGRLSSVMMIVAIVMLLSACSTQGDSMQGNLDGLLSQVTELLFPGQSPPTGVVPEFTAITLIESESVRSLPVASPLVVSTNEELLIYSRFSGADGFSDDKPVTIEVSINKQVVEFETEPANIEVSYRAAAENELAAVIPCVRWLTVNDINNYRFGPVYRLEQCAVDIPPELVIDWSATSEELLLLWKTGSTPGIYELTIRPVSQPAENETNDEPDNEISLEIRVLDLL
jgi:hypothetical protein